MKSVKDGPDKKRIIICTNVYLPKFIGGAELIAHYHAKILKQQGHDVIIFAGDPGESKRYLLSQDTYDALTIHRVCLSHKDYSSDFINFSHKKVERYFKAILERFLPDVVHFHNIIGVSVGLIHIAKSKGIKTILTVHDHWGFCYKNTIIKRDGEICRDYALCNECMPFIYDGDNKGMPIRMRKDFIEMQLREVDAFISPSRYLAETYIRAGIPKEKFRVIWYGIDVRKFSNVSKTAMNGCVRFSFIGYFGQHKGIHTLLSALPFLDDKDHFRINLVGDGELMDSCTQQVKVMGLKGLVKFWGKIDNSRIEKVHRETDVLILPSVWPENQPVSITEAMATRTPVIASRMGGIPELIEDGKTGYLFEAGNAKQLAQKMSEFILHPDRLQTFGENAYNKIVNYTFENQVDKILQVYDEEMLNHKKQQQEEKLIVCVGEHINPQCAQTMDAFLKKHKHDIYRFVMSDWIEEDQLRKAKLLWIVDSKARFEDVTVGLWNRIPLLAPEDNTELKKLCSSANCGLYYRNADEAEACIEYLMQNESVAYTIGQSGYKYLKMIS